MESSAPVHAWRAAACVQRRDHARASCVQLVCSVRAACKQCARMVCAVHGVRCAWCAQCTARLKEALFGERVEGREPLELHSEQ